MDKHRLVQQLIAKVGAAAKVASEESVKAAREVQSGVTGKERREDARVALEFGGIARGQKRRAQQMRAELTRLERFEPFGVLEDGSIALGSLVEIEDEESELGRTIFLAPAGAGVELTAPGGDGFFSVVTPASPIGRAVVGCRVGDSIEITVGSETRYWEITWAE